MMKKLAVLSVLLLCFSAKSAFAEVYSVSNDYIKISVDDYTGRFMLETVGGDPDSDGDDNAVLLYKRVPPTSLTTLLIEDEEFIFGSDSGSFERRAEVSGTKIITEWSVRGIVVIQEVGIVTGPSTGREDCMRVLYKIKNDANQKKDVGLRILFDTSLGDTDGSPFRVPGSGEIEYETQFYRDELPEYWYSFDDFDDPQIRSQGILSGHGVTTPDKIIFASWDRLYDNLWDFVVDTDNDLSVSGSAHEDSAVALYYDELELAKDEIIMYSALYGLYGASYISADDFTLSVSVPAEPKIPPVTVAAEIKNTSDDTTFDSLILELDIPDGFYLDDGETNVLEFVKVAPGETKEAVWYLNCGSIGGMFTIDVNATALLGENSQELSTEKEFMMNYLENIVVDNTETVVEELNNQVDEKVSNAIAMETNESTTGTTTTTIPAVVTTVTTIEAEEDRFYEFSAEEISIQSEIDDLDLLIEEINRKYEILLGIYQRTYQTNVAVQTIEEEVDYYWSRLDEEELLLEEQLAEWD